MISPKDLKLTNNFIQNLKIASNYIYTVDGTAGFYKGLTAATLKASFGSYLYFWMLRELDGDDEIKNTKLRNFWISCTSRIFSTFMTNALNII